MRTKKRIIITRQPAESDLTARTDADTAHSISP